MIPRGKFHFKKLFNPKWDKVSINGPSEIVEDSL